MIESRGVATVAIGLVRPHIEKTKAPRGLFVPFPLGRPFGEPEDTAFQARVLMHACGAVPPADLDGRQRYEVTSVRDLGTKLPSRPIETALHGKIDLNAHRVYASPLVEAYEAAGRAVDLHVGAHVRYRNETPEADPRTVVLFGDSYAHFAPIMLSGLIAETFREVHFVWSSSIDWSFSTPFA